MDPTSMYLQWIAAQRRAQQAQAMSRPPHPGIVDAAMSYRPQPMYATGRMQQLWPGMPEGYHSGGPGPAAPSGGVSPHAWGSMSGGRQPAPAAPSAPLGRPPAPPSDLPEGYSSGGPGSQYAPSSDPTSGNPHSWGMLSGRRRPW